MEEEVVPEGMQTLENASIYAKLEAKQNADIQYEMLETMRSLKDDLDSLKTNNIILMNAKSDQEEIYMLILKILIDQAPQNISS